MAAVRKKNLPQRIQRKKNGVEPPCQLLRESALSGQRWASNNNYPPAIHP
jgi:hypothetical protein